MRRNVAAAPQAARNRVILEVNRTRRALFILLLFVAVQVFAAGAVAPDDEIVALNTRSLKYHCVKCHAAKACTKNCIEIRKADAKARGGVACRLCAGTCAMTDTVL